MGYELILEIDDVPESLNRMLRTHRFKANKIKKSWYYKISKLVGPNRPKSPLKKASISIERHSNRFLDYDNAVASYKMVVDGLVLCGVLDDDNWGVTGPWEFNQIYRPKKDGGLSVLKVVEKD